MWLLKYFIGFLVFLFCTCNYNLLAQSNQSLNDTINQFNDRGEKHGWWVEYLTKKFRSVKKEKNAVFYRYKRYYNGGRFDPEIGPPVAFIRISTSLDILLPGREKPILLNGTVLIYRKYKKRNIIIQKHIFKDGVLLNITDYYKDGSVEEYFDYNEKYKKYNDKEFSYHIKDYNEYGDMTQELFIVIDNSKTKLFDGNGNLLSWKRIK
jgi:hypothetical protein